MAPPPLFTELYESIVIPPDPSTDPARPPLLMFFVTGNPGLVEYYRTYLTQLHAASCAALPSRAVHVYACSLAGFETSAGKRRVTEAQYGKGPYTLVQQVRFVDEALACAQAEVHAAQTLAVGHSVGTYMLLEVLQGRRRAARGQREGVVKGRGVLGAILITPTVMDLRASSSGRKVRAIAALPYFPEVTSTLARVLTWPVPDWLLLRLIRLATGMPEGPAETTRQFIRSEMGLYQSLFLLVHELREMTADKWDDDVWGVVEGRGDVAPVEPESATRLFLYFAPKDHWIADETRQHIINVRGSGTAPGGPTMEVAAHDFPHAFCLQHNEHAVQKTMEYIQKLFAMSVR